MIIKIDGTNSQVQQIKIYHVNQNYLHIGFYTSLFQNCPLCDYTTVNIVIDQYQCQTNVEYNKFSIKI